jgi:hypothetical protein
MKREIAELWSKALRSGEFKQTTGQLEKDGKYCACGVLAAIALTEGICTYDVGGKFDGTLVITFLQHHGLGRHCSI